MLAPGTLLASRFLIERQAGTGGMSAVYRALDVRAGRHVAVKLLGERADGALLLQDEARALATLAHPGIVRYVDHGTTPDGAFLAMEWIEGESLEERLARGPLDAGETLTLALRVSEALAVAHAAGLVHRDIKPSNLLLPGGNLEHVTVVDFGIARASASRATQTGIIVGTPGYMAPEQARGERAVDARADVFSLGCVLYECLAGEAPFRGAHVMAVLLKVVLEDPPRLSELSLRLPDGFEELISRMMAKDRAARPADGAVLERELMTLRVPRRRPVSSGTMHAVIGAGEQRLLSIVLARAPFDAAGQDDTIAMVDPHESGGTLDAVRHAAQAHQAFHERLADGSIVATLSATGAASDLAVRAARLAIALRSALKGWSVSLATGRGELSARWPVGEAVDRAVEILGNAGRIRLDDASAGLLAAHFAIDGDERAPELGPELEGPESNRTVLGRPTPYVGREQELLGILGNFEHCVAEHVSRAVLAVGVPGIGKSRLRHELLHNVAGRAQVLVARGDALRAGTPFGLLGAAVRRLCRIREEEDLEARRRRLLARVDRVVPGPAGTTIAHFLGEIAAVPFGDDDDVQLRTARQDPMLMSDQSLRAFVDWLSAECARAPVAVVLDDLQWGDEPTVRLVDAALAALADRRLFVLGLARPEIENVFPDLWAAREVQRWTLGPLTARATERIVRAVLGPEVPTERLKRLVAQAEGNAFLVEELVRAEAAGRRDETPPTVLAMLHARIEALPPATRRVLRAASVYGRTFWRGGTQALLGDAGGLDLDAALDELVRAEMVVRRAQSRYAGEPQFQIRHDLLRDAAYGTLTSADQTLGHRLAARWLEGAGEKDALVLAEHHDRGGQPTRAAPWWLVATRQALEGHDLEAVMTRAERGVAAGATGATLGALRLAQLEAANWRGDGARALEAGLAAIASLSPGTPTWFAAAGELAVAAGRMGATDRLRATADMLVEADASEATALAAAQACAQAIPTLVYATELRRADLLLARLPVVDDALATSHPRLAGHVLWAHAIRAIAAGDLARYRVDMEASCPVFERAGDLRSAALARVHVGYAALQLGDLARALDLLRQALDAGRRLKARTIETLALHNLGLALLESGSVDEALAIENEAKEGTIVAQNPRLQAACSAYLARVHLGAGRFDEAAHELAEALEVLDEQTPPDTADGPSEPARPGMPVAALVLTTLAELRTARGQPSGALSASRQAMAILEHLGALEESEGRVRLVYAETLLGAGWQAEARAAILAARERLLERAARIGDPPMRASFLGRVPEHARTLALAAEWEGRPPGL